MATPKKQSDEDLMFAVELLTILQVAKGLRWIELGKIPDVKFGARTYRIPARMEMDTERGEPF